MVSVAAPSAADHVVTVTDVLPPGAHREPVATVRRLTGPLTGMVLWAVHLGVCYVTVALFHHGERRDASFGPLSAADALVLALTLAAAVPTAWAAWAGWAAWRQSTPPPGQDPDDLPAFGGLLGALANLLFLFAIVLEGLVVLWLPS